ncbi:MAG: aldo/keto reductase, partial [Sandaracinaceae bacterium]
MTLELSPIAFGAMAHAGARAPGERVELIERAVEEGITTLDTAPLYGFGESERLVGRAIASRRDRVQVLSKVGLAWDAEARGELLFATPDRRVVCDSRPERVQREVLASLERLGIERLDLVQVHHPDRLTPIGETFGALKDLVGQGRARAVGASNFSPVQLEEARRALAPTPLFSTQERYSLVYRDVERTLVPYCAANGVGLLAYSPLAQGILAGRTLFGGAMPKHDFRTADPSFLPGNLAAIHRAIRRSLDPIAEARGVSIGAVALAWLKARPTVRTVIAGASSPTQLAELARALRLELTDHERAEIEVA